MKDTGFKQQLSTFKREEGALIPLLQETQKEFGYLPTIAIREIAHFLKISENQIYGVASFYSQFRFTEPGRNSIKVCLGTACHVKGGQVLHQALERTLDVTSGKTTADKRFDLNRVACLGCCALAPVVQINNDTYSQMTVIRIKKILEKYE